MTDENSSIDVDTVIGNALCQAEAAVTIDEESLAQEKQRLLTWMAKANTANVGPTTSQNTKDHEAVGPWGPSLSEVRFLTVAEVASLMRVSKMTVYRLVHSGHLPAIRVGRSFRVPEQVVHEYLCENFVESFNRL